MVAHPGKILPGALLALSIFTGGAPAAQDPRQAVKAEENLSGLHDFDFLIGDWRVRHRLIQGGQWVEFDGTSSTRKLMGGYGNVEDNVLQRPGGSYKAVGLRSYDSKSGQWAIWWLDGRNPLGLLDPAVTRLVIVPDGSLHRVPWDALRMRDEDGVERLLGGE